MARKQLKTGTGPVVALPRLRLIDCEGERRNAQCSAVRSICRVLADQANKGEVARVVIIYDNGPETLPELVSSMWSGSRVGIRETLALAQQMVAHCAALLNEAGE